MVTVAVAREAPSRSYLLQRLGFGPGAFRLCLAAAVFLQHVSRFETGRTAVMLFFMLSGYWVSRMQSGAGAKPYARFVLNRFLRIWPLLCVAAAFCAFGLPLLFGLHRGGSFLSTIGLFGLATRNDDVDGTIWSLDIEAQFYLLLPLVLFAIAGARLGRRTFALASVAICGIGTALTLRFAVANVLFYWPMFAAGVSICVHRWKPSGRWALISLLAVCVGIAANQALLHIPFSPSGGPRDGPLPFITYDAATMAIALLGAPMIAWVVSLPSNRRDHHLGDAAYPFYLFHVPLIFVSLAFIGGMAGKVVALVAAAAVTYLAERFIDRPLERLRRRYA